MLTMYMHINCMCTGQMYCVQCMYNTNHAATLVFDNFLINIETCFNLSIVAKHELDNRSSCKKEIIKMTYSLLY